MKKFTLILFLLTLILKAGEEFQLNSIITEEMWTEGFTASVKTTSNFPGAKAADTYTIYSDDEGNKRIETKENITLFLTDDESEKLYKYNNLTKTYTVISVDDLPEGESVDKPADFDEEDTVELVGSDTFAGVKCDKYKMDTRGMKIEGDSFIFVDPVTKILMGMEIKSGDKFFRTEYSNMEFGVDKELFKPLDGYEKK